MRYEEVPPPPDLRDGRPAGLDLALAVDDPEGAVDAAVAAGADLVEPVVRKPWGQRTACLRDPDGLLIEVATEVDRTHGAAPAAG